MMKKWKLSQFGRWLSCGTALLLISIALAFAAAGLGGKSDVDSGGGGAASPGPSTPGGTGGSPSPSPPDSPGQPPQAPESLDVLRVTADYAVVIWLPVEGASAYRVYANDYPMVEVTAVNRATVTDLVPSTWYSFQVVALNTAGESEKSAVSRARTQAVAFPETTGQGTDWGVWVSAWGSLLSGAAAVGTLYHAVSVHRQARRGTPEPQPGEAD
ncbi:fibronectin type III domain-containing protein [Streptomyces sp. CRN 30]|uniref:fibronectin type III domain-containing protein n=1 Tax=Streptomyces sp. CRN 30 TaxID=3075613 RepID=UPI002A819C74|nr:fibronectin type III domain-containing protein [Streptomyces sp. CRN 30]